MIGPETSRHPFNQSDAKLKKIATRSPAFSRASSRLSVLTLSSHWLMMMLIFVVIDSCDNLISVFQHSIEENYLITRLIDFCFFQVWILSARLFFHSILTTKVRKPMVKNNPEWFRFEFRVRPTIVWFFTFTALGYACLAAFIPKYLHNFFLKDNSAIIQGERSYRSFLNIFCFIFKNH